MASQASGCHYCIALAIALEKNISIEVKTYAI